jgi:hypothetical protein
MIEIARGICHVSTICETVIMKFPARHADDTPPAVSGTS